MIMTGFLFCIGVFVALLVLANLGLVLRLAFWGIVAAVGLIALLWMFH